MSALSLASPCRCSVFVSQSRVFCSCSHRQQLVTHSAMPNYSFWLFKNNDHLHTGFTMPWRLLRNKMHQNKLELFHINFKTRISIVVLTSACCMADFTGLSAAYNTNTQHAVNHNKLRTFSWLRQLVVPAPVTDTTHLVLQ